MESNGHADMSSYVGTNIVQKFVGVATFFCLRLTQGGPDDPGSDAKNDSENSVFIDSVILFFSHAMIVRLV